MSMIRTRWAAIGAALAVTLGGAGVGLVSATISSGERNVFVPITPCRIIDTRSDFTIGPKSTPLGADETHTVDAHGTNGECTLPSDATGLALNVTATHATMGTFLAIWGDGPRPNASALNPQPGQPPTPNAVTTELTTAGAFNIFNKQGTVDVFVDVVGYYADHNHDDLYYTRAEADAQFVPQSPNAVSVSPSEMQRLQEGTNWENPASLWTHAPASTSHECIIGPIDLVPFKNVLSMAIVYNNPGGPQSIQVALAGSLDQPGPVSSAIHTVFAAPVTAPGTTSNFEQLDVPVGGLVRLGHNYSVLICAQEVINVSAVHVGLGVL